MIDLDAIPDEKPRRGPARMGKSEKDADARRRYKIRQHIPRLEMFYLREITEKWRHSMDLLAPATRENHD